MINRQFMPKTGLYPYLPGVIKCDSCVNHTPKRMNYYSTKVLQYYSTTVLQYYSTTDSTAVLQYHSTTVHCVIYLV